MNGLAIADGETLKPSILGFVKREVAALLA